MTQQELAELAGVGLRFLKELEQDKSTTQMASVNAVLKPFGKQLGIVDRQRDLEEEAEVVEGSTLVRRDDYVGRTLNRERPRLFLRFDTSW